MVATWGLLAQCDLEGRHHVGGGKKHHVGHERGMSRSEAQKKKKKKKQKTGEKKKFGTQTYCCCLVCWCTAVTPRKGAFMVEAAKNGSGGGKGARRT